MSNYYTMFSFEIESITDEERQWLREKYEAGYSEDDSGVRFEINFELDLDQSKAAWFHSEDGGDIAVVADFVTEFIDKFRPNEIVVIEWADTCSKPVVGGFGGGAVVISKEGQEWLGTYAWANETVEKIKKSRS